MNQPLSVLVTGSSRGIGRAIALRLAASGYQVIVHCRDNLAAAEEVCGLIEQNNPRVLRFDIADRAACAEAIVADIEAHGAYYGVVCNAGLARDGAFPALEEELMALGSGDLEHSPDRADALVWAVSELMLGIGRTPRLRAL